MRTQFGANPSSRGRPLHDHTRSFALSRCGRCRSNVRRCPNGVAGQFEGANRVTEQPATVFVVDDNESVRHSMFELLTSVPLPVETFGSSKEFLDAFRPE